MSNALHKKIHEQRTRCRKCGNKKLTYKSGYGMLCEKCGWELSGFGMLCEKYGWELKNSRKEIEDANSDQTRTLNNK